MNTIITSLAAAQHGVITRRQLLAAGIPPDTIRELVRSRRLRRVSYGVYVLPGTPASPEQEAMIAVVRCGPGARVAGERMLGFLGIQGADRAGPFTVLTRPGRRVTGVPWQLRTNPVAPRLDAAEVVGIDSFVPARHVLEVAVDGADAVLERLVDGLRWSARGVRPLQRLMRVRSEHPGVPRLAASGLVETDAGESPPERSLFDLFSHLSPRRQVRLLDSYVVDLFLPAARLVIEYDGELHVAPARRGADIARDAALAAAGIMVLRVTKADLRDEGALVRRVERLVAQRATATTHP